MKTIKKLGALMMCLAVMLGCAPLLMAGAAEGAMMTLQAAESKTLSYQHAEKKKLGLVVTNTGSAELKNIKISPRISEDIDVWPFEIENKDYAYTIDSLPKGEAKTIEFEFTARENVTTKYYKLPFDFTAQAADESAAEIDGEYGLYVKTIAKPEEKPQDGKDDQNQDPGQVPEGPSGQGGSGGIDLGGSGDGGGITNVGPSGSGSGMTPRVIVTGFSTDPGEVKAGSNFKLTIHLKNTSKTTAVSNMLFDLSAPTEGMDAATASPAFLPASGSSTIYLEKIKANGVQDISIELNAKADLVQKPYSVDVSMKYEDADGGQYDSASSISIPVKQDARFEFSEFEISPNVISVGDETNIMCNIYNLGRVKLYNVKARFEGEGIQTEEVFVGNVESGATANIDAMLTAESPTMGPASMKMTMSYEDESGVVSSMEKEFQLEITEMMEPVDMGMDPGFMVEEPKKAPIVPIVVALLIIVGVIVGLVVYKKKKNRRLREEEEGLVDEFDRLTEDEHRKS